MSEATRLKMTGGHFIWIWADTSSTAEFFQAFDITNDYREQQMSSKGNYDDFVNRKQKQNSNSRQFYQQQPSSGNNRRNNQTKYKSINSNRFHHIIGLRKPSDESFMDEREALKFVNDDPRSNRNDLHQSTVEDIIPLKDKRKDQKKLSSNNKKVTQDSSQNSKTFADDLVSSIENEKTANNLNIKNINSNEFNAFYYDPYERQRPNQNRMDVDDENFPENIFGGSDFDESTDEEPVYYDYDKINPFHPNTNPAASATSTVPSTSTRRVDTTTSRNIDKLKVSSTKAPNRPTSTSTSTQKPGTITQQSPNLSVDDLDLENYSDTSNDSKAKRADNFHPQFNISSHVFFHHFKDFPVGLLALRHIKMNVDRVFVRSAIRLFASTWARVERNEEIRFGSSNSEYSSKSHGSGRSYYNDYGENISNRNNNNKVKSKAHVNNRNDPIRRKFKREAQMDQTTETATEIHINERSISTLVNSSLNNTNLIKNINDKISEHVSGLKTQQLHSSDVEIKSNIDNFSHKNNSYNKTISRNVQQLEKASYVPSNGDDEKEIKLKKRPDTWWSPNILRGGSITNSPSSTNIRNNQDRIKVTGTPQYKGGCFGSASRSDLKRSEVFARLVKLFNSS
jgi:hypothetical protein